MAVSIEIYRCRIGQFQSNKYKSRIQYKAKSYRKVEESSLISRIIRVAFLITVTLLSSTWPLSTHPLPYPGYTCSPVTIPSQLGHGDQVLQPQPSHGVHLQQYDHDEVPPPQPDHANHPNLLPQPDHGEQVLPPPPVDHNFLARYKFGNRSQKKGGINIIHWNKGSSILSNKMGDLEAIVENHRPLLLCISEANLRKYDDFDDVQLPDYTLHTCPTIDNPEHGVSRVVVYTHKSLIVKPRPDLMNPWLSAVWLEVGLPRRHKFLLCNAYREWGYPNQQDRASHSINAQRERWTMFLDRWQVGIQEGKEIIVLGDLNLCHLKWNQLDLPKTCLTHKLLS